MTVRLTQGMVRRVQEDHPPGTQLYDEDVSGLRLVVGSKSSSYKFMGRINDGTGRYMTITIGRADEVALKTARARAVEIRQQLARGEDPRKPKSKVPTLVEVLESVNPGAKWVSVPVESSPAAAVWQAPWRVRSHIAGARQGALAVGQFFDSVDLFSVFRFWLCGSVGAGSFRRSSRGCGHGGLYDVTTTERDAYAGTPYERQDSRGLRYSAHRTKLERISVGH